MGADQQSRRTARRGRTQRRLTIRSSGGRISLRCSYPLRALAVEVRSPSTWRYDIGAKKAAYERGGLAELWLVDTRASELFAFRWSMPGAPSFDVALELGAPDTLASPLLPGFALALGPLFGD